MYIIDGSLEHPLEDFYVMCWYALAGDNANHVSKTITKLQTSSCVQKAEARATYVFHADFLKDARQDMFPHGQHQYGTSHFIHPRS